jgi:hypothetical protein
VQVETLRQVQRRLAFLMPPAIALFGLGHAWRNSFSTPYLTAACGLLVFGLTLAVSLYKRSKNQETAWATARVLPDPPGAEHEPVNPLSPDFLFVVGAIVLVLLAFFLPYLRG